MQLGSSFKSTVKPCVMCATTSSQHWCYKCQNKVLLERVHRLEEQLGYILNLSSDALIVSRYDRFNSSRYFNFSEIISQESFPKPAPKEMPYYWFFTITFDPMKFGVGNQAKDEEAYIIYSLYEVREFYIQLIGCFELTKQGTTHAHFIVRTYRPNELHKALKKRFTDNPRNNVAIHKGLAKFPTSYDYIVKDKGVKFTFIDMDDTKNTLDFIS